MYYCQVLKDLRESNYYTQDYIARILNVGQRTYCDYEQGKTRIPIDSIIRLAMLYDVDLNYICGISNVKSSFPKK
ncbi:MAG: helix-turn-helix transcriptional regulator [Clostridia bacterium]|nr:helix-turn-helix transcriptional regulator [Clostridia bacterium]